MEDYLFFFSGPTNPIVISAVSRKAVILGAKEPAKESKELRGDENSVLIDLIGERFRAPRIFQITGCRTVAVIN